jgi:hypothetical protein
MIILPEWKFDVNIELIYMNINMNIINLTDKNDKNDINQESPFSCKIADNVRYILYYYKHKYSNDDYIKNTLPLIHFIELYSFFQIHIPIPKLYNSIGEPDIDESNMILNEYDACLKGLDNLVNVIYRKYI